MFQTRGARGKNLILGAISSFDNIAQDLEEGIEHCKAEVCRHQEIISDAHSEINNLNENMEKADRVLGRVRKLTE